MSQYPFSPAEKGFKVYLDESVSELKFESRGFPVIQVFDFHSKPIGMILGTFINWQESVICNESIFLNCSEKAYSETPSLLEEELYSHSGSWIAFFLTQRLARVYLDCNASLGLVFDSKLLTAASATLGILNFDNYKHRLDNDLIKQLDVASDGWFPSGLTAHKGIQRLLPNHYLDLSIWTAIRHWPNEPIVRHALGEPVAVINQIVNGTIKSLLKDGNRASIALTAGNETRYLLAISKLVWADLTFVSVQFPNSDLDVYSAKCLANQFQLNHQILPCIQSSSTEIECFPFLVSHSVSGGAGAVYAKTLDPLRQYKYFVGGLGGEVGRAYIHKASDNDDTIIDANGILRRLGLPLIPVVVSATEEWLDGIKHLPSSLIIDLAYIELRMGPWGFGVSYAPYPCTQIHPLVNRDIYTCLLSLPLTERKNNFIQHLVHELMPEALNLPVNKYGNWRDYSVFFKRITLRKIISKLRKKIA